MDNDMRTMILDKYDLGNATIKLVMGFKVNGHMEVHDIHKYIVTFERYSVKHYALIKNADKARRTYNQLLGIMAAAAILDERVSTDMWLEMRAILDNVHEGTPNNG